MPSPDRPPLDLRLVWGPLGARSLEPDVDIAVVVDVLSFTTTVTVAADRGTAVVPHPTGDEGAARLAAEQGAVLAVRRSSAGPGDVSLSPVSVRGAASLDRLVLPSPNGSTLSRLLDTPGRSVVAAALRNAAAVSTWIGDRTTARPTRVAVVAAGERRPDGTVRQAPEDVWGAGAVLAPLQALPGVRLCERAEAACDAWRAVASSPARALRRSRTGIELVEWGYGADVDVAAEVDASRAVPVLDAGAYVDAAHAVEPL